MHGRSNDSFSNPLGKASMFSAAPLRLDTRSSNDQRVALIGLLFIEVPAHRAENIGFTLVETATKCPFCF